MATTVSDRSEIVFFDLETTVPREGQGHAILEFGSILVCPRRLDELESYSTLVRPTDPSLISNFSGRSNGITKDGILSAVTFAEIADRVYDILHGRIWAGHNILRFDCARIREAFAEIDRPPPEPKGIIDSLAVLTQKFGRRAGDMKMATLATYFSLGKQTHRSLDDVRMNLEVVKRCATVLFLESTLPNIFTENSWVSPNAVTRSRSNGKVKNAAASSSNTKTDDIEKPSSPTNQSLEELHPILSLMENEAPADTFDMSPLTAEMERETLEVIRSQDDFIDPDEVSIPCISVSMEHFYRRTQIQVTHYDMPLQLCCTRLRVRFGINRRYVDKAGRPLLNFVVDATPSLCRVLNECDSLAQKLSVDSGSNSEWKSMVTRKGGFSNPPTVKLCIPTVGYGDAARWDTDMYQKENSASEPQKIVFDRFDFEEVVSLFAPGTIVDAYFSLDAYDYQQKQIAGIRLVAKKLIKNSNRSV